MTEILQSAFMVKALLAGLLVALTVPLLGAFLVARRYSLISDSLAHLSLAGIGAGLLFGYAPIALAVPVTVVGALAIEWLRQSRRLSGEVSLAIMMSAGLAVAVTFAGLAPPGTDTDFEGYLFGSIAATTTGDVIALGCAALITLLFVFLNYKSLLHIAFDEDSARIAGIKVTLYNYLLIALTAVVVVLSLHIVGGLLMGALLVMPIVTAGYFTRSFSSTVLVAVMAAVFAVIIGLIIAFYAGIAAGGAIVLVAVLLLVSAMAWKR